MFSLTYASLCEKRATQGGTPLILKRATTMLRATERHTRRGLAIIRSILSPRVTSRAYDKKVTTARSLRKLEPVRVRLELIIDDFFHATKVVDHYETPRNVGSFDKTDLNVGTGVVGAPACGDVMKLQIKVDEEGNIVDSCFKTFGCGSAIASSSVATEWIKGTHVDEAVTIKNQDIAKHLNLPPVKLHCSMLAEDAIRSAVADVKAKRAAAKAASSS